MGEVISFPKRPLLTCKCGWKIPLKVGYEMEIRGELEKIVVLFDCPECQEQFESNFRVEKQERP